MSYPNFDEVIDRVGTHSAKWDAMEDRYGVSPQDGIPMWVADMDFRPPECVQTALQRMLDQGIYGYFAGDEDYRAAICWWMAERHGWTLAPGAIFTTHGLVNGTAVCVDTYTEPGDAVILFTPVYHAFSRVIAAAGREVRELPLANVDGRYEMDFERYESLMTGREKMIVLCSPHNPGGRVWTREELEALAEFARKHDLLIVSDEIHHDLVMPGYKHTPMALIDGVDDRLVMMTATSKTFNLAGGHTGNVIIHDHALRDQFQAKMGALGLAPNSFGVTMATAAYSPEGASWVDHLVDYIDGNRHLFDSGIGAIPGVATMKLEGTYLSWVDFSGIGMNAEQAAERVEKIAKIAVNHGPTFGKGGETFLRFNLGTRRALVVEAVERLQEAFADLQ